MILFYVLRQLHCFFYNHRLKMFTKDHLKTYQIVAAILCLVFAIKIMLHRNYDNIDCLYYVKQQTCGKSVYSFRDAVFTRFKIHK